MVLCATAILRGFNNVWLSGLDVLASSVRVAAMIYWLVKE